MLRPFDSTASGIVIYPKNKSNGVGTKRAAENWCCSIQGGHDGIS